MVLLGSCKDLERIEGIMDVSGKQVFPGSSDGVWATCELVVAPKLVGGCTATKLWVLFVEGRIKACHFITLVDTTVLLSRNVK